MDDGDLAEALFGNRFMATRVLKRGLGHVTYKGRDLHQERDMIIKTAAAEDFGPTGKVRLEYEVALLNQFGVYRGGGTIHIGTEGDTIFIARPFVAGVTLEERLRRRPLSPRDTALLGMEILSTLARIHPEGAFHYGIKPSNVVLGDGRPARAQLIDFELARYARTSVAPTGSLSAARYLSPEQSGLIALPVDGRSDLYSAGVVMYESLAGKSPFNGQTVGDLLRAHLTARPAPLRKHVSGVPRELELIIERLLRKDPRDRYQTPAGPLADLEQLVKAPEEGRAPNLVVGGSDLRSAVTEPAFIGRTRELQALEETLSRARERDGGLVLIEGESGHGKTWLLAELGRRAAAVGARVLHGHGLDRVARRPYHVLSEVVRELIAKVQLDPSWGRDIVERLGPFGGAACATMPELRRVLPDHGRSSLGPEQYGERRSLAALAALIDAIGGPEQPVVILIDDGQWIDDSSLRLLEWWLSQRPLNGKRHTVIAVAFRGEEIGEEHPLRPLEQMLHLHLSKFAAEEVREQIASMAGRLPEDAVQAVLRHSGGSPFLVSATLHGMVEAGALRAGASGWQVDSSKMADLQAADHAAQILTLRLNKLSGTQRRLLSIAALLGRHFDPVLAGTLAGLEPSDAMRMIEERRGPLLWADDAGTTFTFVHDKLRDALLEDLSDVQRRELHRRAAEHIMAQQPERVYELAYHFDAAGEAVKALPFALDAAEQSKERFALALAEFYYRIAARGASSEDRSTRLMIHRGLADVLTLRNQYDEAADHYHRALEIAETKRQRAEVEQRWSLHEMKRGDMHAACMHAENALRLVGQRVPPNKLALTASALWELVVQVLHTQLPKLFVRPRKSRADKADDELFAFDIYHGLIAPYFFSRDIMWSVWDHLRLINLAERYPGSRALGRAYAVHMVMLTNFPRLYPRALRISKAGADLCEQLGDLWGQAQGLIFHAASLYFVGRFDEAVEVGRKGAELFDRTGDRWEANTGLDFAMYALVRKGDLAGGLAQAKELWQRGLEIDDSKALAWAVDTWSRTTDGRVPAEMVELARSRSRDLQTSLAVAQADGVRLIAEEKLDEAITVLEEARRRNEEEAGYYFDLNTHVLTYLVTALRMKAERTSARNPKRRRQLLDRASVAVKQALAVTKKHRLSRAHALRECALLDAMQGEPEEARARIDESVAVASELGERYELAQSRLIRAELGLELGWSGADEELAAAREDLAVLRAPLRLVDDSSEPRATGQVTLSLIDRFSTILESGRAIATALNPETIYSQARRAALLLLRAEHCVVLERSGEADPAGFVPVQGDVGISCSNEVIRRSLEQRCSVALSAAEALEDLTSQRTAARSVLSIPIRVRGSVHACLYLTHREVGDLFGQDEQRIGDFLGILTGAALENAEGFSRLETLSRELEERVEERTRQLAQANEELEESLRQVRETQEQLVQASKMSALGTLVAGLSHELNNPLTVVLGYVQLLLRQNGEDAAARPALVAVERQAQRCSGLVKALLDFCRREPAAPRPISPASLCATVVQLSAASEPEKEVKVRGELPAEPLPDLIASSPEIESVLLNLLSNGIDAAPPGGEVVLEARAESREGVPGVLFSVSDTGPGIPRDVLPRIFDPFFTTKPPGRGTGLGLSIAHQSVTTHGGAIEVDTNEDEGTTISVWLPKGDRFPALTPAKQQGFSK